MIGPVGKWVFGVTRQEQITSMQILNSMLKWSLAVSGMTMMAVLGGMFALWLLIEILAWLVGLDV